MNVFAGTYERFVFGFKVVPGDGDEAHSVHLERYCTYAAHQHAVKCVASGGYFLASGGLDDQIHLYDIKRDKDLGFLMNPGDGAVPCIQFYCPPGAGGAPSHMFSGSADGSIAVWRAGGDWEHLKLMKGHTGSINSLSVHPSGRLALSVAHDCSLRMWDLAKGRSTYTTKLDAESEAVQFNQAGDAYLLLWGNKVTVHDVGGEGQVTAQLDHARRVTSMTQLTDTLLLTGGEDGGIKVWDLRSNKVQQSIERSHTTRVRGLVTFNTPGAAASSLLCSAASDGVVKLWDVRALSSSTSGSAEVPCLAEVATRARVTCLTVVNKAAPGPKPPSQAPKAAAEEPKAQPAKAGAPGKQAGKPPAGQAGQGKGKSDKVVGKPGKGSSKPVRVAKPEPLGFEIVSEAQQAAHQRKRVASDSDDDDDDKGGADPVKLAKRKLGVTPKKAKKAGGGKSLVAQQRRPR